MITETVNLVLQWLNAHPNLSGLVTFVVSALESVAIIGTIIPGTLMMTAIGTLAGAGVIPLYSTIVWAILGAIVGDGLSYWAGYHFKDHLRVIWPFKKNPQILESGERYFRAYGGASVLIGRFVGPVRALVPLVAGMLRMPPLRFTIANVISAIGWAPAYMFPGILLGAASLELPPDIAVHVILVFFLLSLLLFLCLWSSYRIFILIRNQINSSLDKLWRKLQHSPYFHSITTLLRHHDASKLHGQLTLAFYFILTSVGFLYLALYILHHNAATITLNRAFFYFFRSIRNTGWDHIVLWITTFGEMRVIVPVSIIALCWLAWKKCWRTAIHIILLFALACGTSHLFKHWIHSARPWGIHGVAGYSFPSGHATLSIVFYFGIMVLLMHAKKINYPRLLYILVGLIVFTIGTSRLYLGAHWFTDVVGGWLLGSACLMFVTLSYNRQQEHTFPTKSFLLITLLSLISLSWFQYESRFNQQIYNYSALDRPVQTVNLLDWWQQKDKNLPLYRIGRIGIATEMFNLQWVGNLSDIKTLLLEQGWEIPPQRGWIDVLHRITDVSSAEHLPIVSPLYLDKKPVLVLVKNIIGDKKLLVLRLWSSNIKIKHYAAPLWVGSVGMVPRTYSWLFKYKNMKDINIDSSYLFNKRPPQYEIKEIPTEEKLKHKHRLKNVILIRPTI